MNRGAHSGWLSVLVLLLGGQWANAESQDPGTHALAWGRRLLGDANVVAEPYDTYWNLDGTPHAVLFLCQPAGETAGRRLTLGLSPNEARGRVLFFYEADPVDRPFRPTEAARAGSRVIVSAGGLLLQTGGTFQRIPHPDVPEQFGVGAFGSVKPETTAEMAPDFPAASKALSQAPPSLSAVTNEMIIPGVPNYLWYLNCALTSETMLLGYWNDHGCAGLVPGLNSSGGCYAITEELMWLRNDRLRAYAAARELGYSWQFDQAALPDKQWATYVAAVQNASGPLLITWSGAPYGAHSTVGVGYREVDSERFLVLHDTWVSSRAYVNYNPYATSIVGITVTTLAPGGGTNPPPSTNAGLTLAYGTVFNRTNLTFSPSLSYSSYSYHCFEGGDFNRDGRSDLLVGNFRNNVSATVRLSLYTNDAVRFTRDAAFAPTLDWYECVHVARACDFDRDSDLDVAVTGYWMPVRVYANTGQALASSATVLGSEYTNYGYHDLAWGDLDGDGDFDLVACVANTIQTEGKLRIFLWQDGAFQPAGGVGMAGHWYTAVRLADLNQDHRPEIVCANRHGSAVAFLNSNGQFTNPPVFAPTQGHGALSVDVGDLNADGFPEIVTVDDGRIVFFHNGPGGLSAEPHYVQTELPTHALDLRLQDLNRDGLPELLAANYNTRSAVFLNRGGAFVPQPLWLSADVDPSVRIQVYESAGPQSTLVGFAKARGGTAGFYGVRQVPVFAGATLAEGKPRFRIENLLPGCEYAVERADRIDADLWRGVFQFDSAGNTMSWTDLDPPAGSPVFYRARCLE